MKRLLRFGVFALLLAAAVAGGAQWALSTLDAPLNLHAAVRYKVAPGASFARVSNELSALGVVPHAKIWSLYARLSGQAAAVKAGEYEISPGLTPRELLAKMVNGQVLLHSFTIVDGWRVEDMFDALRRNPDVSITLPPGPPAAVATALMQKLGEPGVNAEGQFLPETYRFVLGSSDVEVLRQAHAALSRELQAAWADRDADLPLHDAYELLIMASIIQKESGIAQEIPRIAGLYLHRYSIGMRLQADPTVIYGMGEHYDGDIRTVDLRTDGPYNTYTRAGLPPTPIALPSAAVIRATAHPMKSDAIYFVASTKGDGTHVFSSTLEQHNAAVAAYVAHQRHKTAQDPHP